MAEIDTRSLQQIKRETEQTRAGLTETVEQLRTSVAETANDIRERVRPEAIKAEVSDYIRSRGQQLLDEITAAAQKNPMQAVAVGASMAYPLFRLARAIPLPVLMVGAGLFLAGSKTGKAATQKASDVASDISDEVARRARNLGDQIGDQASAATAFASDKLGQLSDAMSGRTEQVTTAANAAGATFASETEQLRAKASSIGSSVADRAADIRDQGARMAGSAADSVKDAAVNAASLGRRVAGSTKEAGLDAARAVRETASDLGDRAGKTILQTIEQNPLLVAGVGLVVGGLIASALPRSEIEDGLIDDAKNSVKRGARVVAAQGINAATNAIGEVFDETARQAQAEGLSPTGLGEAARDIQQRVRRVAETAVTTAFEPPQDHQPNVHGDTDHG